MSDMRDPTETLIMDSASAAPISGTIDASPERIQHYDIRREIGRGGMSVVYEAQDTQTGQDVALKLLSLPATLTPEEAGNLVARFEREARTAARLSHPNVVHIHEIGVYQNQHFLAMEYLKGQTLRERMREGTLTPEEAFPILTQIARALDAAHKAGIVHRDVKPTNVMLLPDGVAKLLDFGIARSSDDVTITHVGVIVGSPSYMAPEQVKGEPGTAATDLWALGVLSYEILAGHLPFAGQTIGEVIYQIMHQSPSQTPDLPAAVQKVLRRALDKRPSQRYPTAGDFIQALKLAYTKPAPVPSEPKSAVSSPRPVSRWLAGASLLALFLLGFCGAFLARHHVSAGVPKEAAAQSPSSPRMLRASLPVASPVTHPALPEHHRVVASRAPRKPKTEARIASLLPPPRKAPIAQPNEQPLTPVKHVAAQAMPVHLAQAAAPQTERIRHAVVAVKPTAVQHVPLRIASRRIPIPSVMQSEARQNSASNPPAQTAEPQTPAQSTTQSFTLPPSDGGSYDPEADARLRKSDWSQNGDAPK